MIFFVPLWRQVGKDCSSSFFSLCHAAALESHVIQWCRVLLIAGYACSATHWDQASHAIHSLLNFPVVRGCVVGLDGRMGHGTKGSHCNALGNECMDGRTSRLVYILQLHTTIIDFVDRLTVRFAATKCAAVRLVYKLRATCFLGSAKRELDSKILFRTCLSP